MSSPLRTGTSPSPFPESNSFVSGLLAPAGKDQLTVVVCSGQEAASDQCLYCWLPFCVLKAHGHDGPSSELYTHTAREADVSNLPTLVPSPQFLDRLGQHQDSEDFVVIQCRVVLSIELQSSEDLIVASHLIDTVVKDRPLEWPAASNAAQQID